MKITVELDKHIVHHAKVMATWKSMGYREYLGKMLTEGVKAQYALLKEGEPCPVTLEIGEESGMNLEIVANAYHCKMEDVAAAILENGVEAEW